MLCVWQVAASQLWYLRCGQRLAAGGEMCACATQEQHLLNLHSSHRFPTFPGMGVPEKWPQQPEQQLFQLVQRCFSAMVPGLLSQQQTQI